MIATTIVFLMKGLGGGGSSGCMQQYSKTSTPLQTPVYQTRKSFQVFQQLLDPFWNQPILKCNIPAMISHLNPLPGDKPQTSPSKYKGKDSMAKFTP